MAEFVGFCGHSGTSKTFEMLKMFNGVAHAYKRCWAAGSRERLEEEYTPVIAMFIIWERHVCFEHLIGCTVRR